MVSQSKPTPPIVPCSLVHAVSLYIQCTCTVVYIQQASGNLKSLDEPIVYGTARERMHW